MIITIYRYLKGTNFNFILVAYGSLIQGGAAGEINVTWSPLHMTDIIYYFSFPEIASTLFSLNNTTCVIEWKYWETILNLNNNKSKVIISQDRPRRQ